MCYESVVGAFGRMVGEESGGREWVRRVGEESGGREWGKRVGEDSG